MSLPKQAIEPVPEDTAQVAQKAFAKGNPYVQMRDLLGTIYTDDVFVDLCPPDGQPAIRPWRLALVTVMQFTENLTDRQATDAVRDRIAWKYALSLSLTDAGFDYSVLCEFRQRLLDHNAAQQLLDVMLKRFAEQGWLKMRSKHRTDSTHILAAIRQLNQLELVHETLRHALNELTVEAPAWLRQRVNADWFDSYSQRTSNYLLPKKDAERKAWAERVGQDGLYLLEQVYAGGHHPELAQLPAVDMLRRIWIQHFYQHEEHICLREKRDQPPASRLIPSPYDPEARCSTKRNVTWIGYKVHLTETCDDDAPNLITNVETRPATEPDHDATGVIHDHLMANGYAPGEHFVDQGYMSIDHVVQQAQVGVDLMGAVPDDNSWQARLGGHDSRQFMLDWENECAVCPQGHTSCSWSLAQTRSQRPVVKIKFRHRDCAACPALHLCTSNHEKRRTLTILAPQALYEAQQVARQRQQSTDFKQACHVRAGVEGTVSQAAHALSARRSRYRGMDKTHLQHLGIAAAINLLRIVNWLNGVPRSKTPQSRFARLAA